MYTSHPIPKQDNYLHHLSPLRCSPSSPDLSSQLSGMLLVPGFISRFYRQADQATQNNCHKLLHLAGISQSEATANTSLEVLSFRSARRSQRNSGVQRIPAAKTFSRHAGCVTAESESVFEWEKRKFREGPREGASLIRIVKGASPGPLQNETPLRKAMTTPQSGGAAKAARVRADF